MIPYGKQSINHKDTDAVQMVLSSEWLTQGPNILKFETALDKYCGAKYAVAVSSGTAALHLAYLAAGLHRGDEVITSPNTFVATTNMLLTCGAKPVFCDIKLDDYNIDEFKIEKLITKKTKMIVPVHFAGRPCNMDKILAIARKNKLLVVEDAAHALGATYQNKKIGGLKSDMTIFSFHPVKSITTGEGGAILTNNYTYYKKMLLLRSHGVIKDARGFNVMRELGYNYRITDIQSALGLSQLERIETFLAHRRQVAKLYKKYLSGVEDVILPQEDMKDIKSSWHLFVIRVKNKNKRNKMMDYLKKNGIGTNFHYPAVYLHPYYRRHGYKMINLKNMGVYNNTCLTIPCFQTLKEKEVRYVAEKIKSFFK